MKKKKKKQALDCVYKIIALRLPVMAMAIRAETKTAAIPLSFSQLQLFPSQSTASKNFKEPMNIYNKRFKHLGQLYVVLICPASPSTFFFFFVFLVD